MAEIRALLPDGTAPSTLKAQIQDEATTAANAVGEQLAEGIGVIAETAVSAAQQATEAKTAVEAVQATLSSETIRIFPSQAEAQAWEAEQEGRIGLWVDQGEPLIEVTAAAPTFNDSTNTYTIPVSEGVDYYVEDGIVTGTRSVGDVDTTVLVSAVARDGYTITGTNVWEGTFTKAATAPVQVTATAPTFDDSADTYTIPTKAGVRYLVGGTVRTGTVTVGDVDTTVTVTAQAESGYTLTGTTTWTGTYTKKPAASADSTAAAGTILASDDFTGDGPLLGRTAVASLGGTARTWRDGTVVGTQGGDAVTSGGKVAAGSNTKYTILPVDRRDVEVSFILTSLPTAGTNVTIRESGAGSRIVMNFPNGGSVRMQRYSAAGGVALPGGFNIGPASIGKRFTLRAVGSELTLIGTGNVGTEVTATATDSGWMEAGIGVGISAGAGFGIDDLVVTAR